MEKRAFEANFTKTVVSGQFKKYYKVFTEQSLFSYETDLPYWRMERICLSNHGTLPSDLSSTEEAKQLLNELLPGS